MHQRNYNVISIVQTLVLHHIKKHNKQKGMNSRT